MAEEQDENAFSQPLRLKQTISVPFLWEEKPGTPKNEWIISKPSPSSPWLTATSPLRLIVSVPFLWEEKPGKPNPQLLALPAPVSYSSTAEDDDQSIPERSIGDGSDHFEDWYSVSETDGNGSWSSSGNQNINGSLDLDASTMEFLFPLTPPRSGFLNKVCRQDITMMPAESEKKCSQLVVKRTSTLEELMLSSRKLSHRRKAEGLQESSMYPITAFPFPVSIMAKN